MTALPASGSFTMVDPTHVMAVGPAAAILFARIVWRSEQTGSWRATRRQLRDETGLTDAMLRTAVAILREHEWVTSERTSVDDATLVWRPILGSDLQMDDSAPPPAESAPPPLRSSRTPPAESAISSLETGKDLGAATAGEGFELVEEEALAAPVPDAFEEWWAAYPRRRKGDSKAAARKAYPRAVKRLGSPAAVMAHLRAWLPELRARESDYLPQGASFLNDRDGKYAEPPPPRRHLAPVPTDPWADTGELPPAPSGDIYGLFTEVGR